MTPDKDKEIPIDNTSTTTKQPEQSEQPIRAKTVTSDQPPPTQPVEQQEIQQQPLQQQQDIQQKVQKPKESKSTSEPDYSLSSALARLKGTMNRNTDGLMDAGRDVLVPNPTLPKQDNPFSLAIKNATDTLVPGTNHDWDSFNKMMDAKVLGNSASNDGMGLTMFKSFFKGIESVGTTAIKAGLNSAVESYYPGTYDFDSLNKQELAALNIVNKYETKNKLTPKKARKLHAEGKLSDKEYKEYSDALAIVDSPAKLQDSAPTDRSVNAWLNLPNYTPRKIRDDYLSSTNFSAFLNRAEEAITPDVNDYWANKADRQMAAMENNDPEYALAMEQVNSGEKQLDRVKINDTYSYGNIVPALTNIIRGHTTQIFKDLSAVDDKLEVGAIAASSFTGTTAGLLLGRRFIKPSVYAVAQGINTYTGLPREALAKYMQEHDGNLPEDPQQVQDWYKQATIGAVAETALGALIPTGAGHVVGKTIGKGLTTAMRSEIASHAGLAVGAGIGLAASKNIASGLTQAAASEISETAREKVLKGRELTKEEKLEISHHASRAFLEGIAGNTAMGVHTGLGLATRAGQIAYSYHPIIGNRRVDAYGNTINMFGTPAPSKKEDGIYSEIVEPEKQKIKEDKVTATLLSGSTKQEGLEEPFDAKNKSVDSVDGIRELAKKTGSVAGAFKAFTNALTGLDSESGGEWRRSIRKLFPFAKDKFSLFDLNPERAENIMDAAHSMFTEERHKHDALLRDLDEARNADHYDQATVNQLVNEVNASAKRFNDISKEYYKVVEAYKKGLNRVDIPAEGEKAVFKPEDPNLYAEYKQKYAEYKEQAKDYEAELKSVDGDFSKLSKESQKGLRKLQNKYTKWLVLHNSYENQKAEVERANKRAVLLADETVPEGAHLVVDEHTGKEFAHDLLINPMQHSVEALEHVSKSGHLGEQEQRLVDGVIALRKNEDFIQSIASLPTEAVSGVFHSLRTLIHNPEAFIEHTSQIQQTIENLTNRLTKLKEQEAPEETINQVQDALFKQDHVLGALHGMINAMINPDGTSKVFPKHENIKRVDLHGFNVKKDINETKVNEWANRSTSKILTRAYLREYSNLNEHEIREVLNKRTIDGDKVRKFIEENQPKDAHWSDRTLINKLDDPDYGTIYERSAVAKKEDRTGIWALQRRARPKQSHGLNTAEQDAVRRIWIANAISGKFRDKNSRSIFNRLLHKLGVPNTNINVGAVLDKLGNPIMNNPLRKEQKNIDKAIKTFTVGGIPRKASAKEIAKAHPELSFREVSAVHSELKKLAKAYEEQVKKGETPTPEKPIEPTEPVETVEEPTDKPDDSNKAKPKPPSGGDEKVAIKDADAETKAGSGHRGAGSGTVDTSKLPTPEEAMAQAQANSESVGIHQNLNTDNGPESDANMIVKLLSHLFSLHAAYHYHFNKDFEKLRALAEEITGITDPRLFGIFMARLKNSANPVEDLGIIHDLMEEFPNDPNKVIQGYKAYLGSTEGKANTGKLSAEPKNKPRKNFKEEELNSGIPDNIVYHHFFVAFRDAKELLAKSNQEIANALKIDIPTAEHLRARLESGVNYQEEIKRVIYVKKVYGQKNLDLYRDHSPIAERPVEPKVEQPTEQPVEEPIESKVEEPLEEPLEQPTAVTEEEVEEPEQVEEPKVEPTSELDEALYSITTPEKLRTLSHREIYGTVLTILKHGSKEQIISALEALAVAHNADKDNIDSLFTRGRTFSEKALNNIRNLPDNIIARLRLYSDLDYSPRSPLTKGWAVDRVLNKILRSDQSSSKLHEDILSAIPDPRIDLSNIDADTLKAIASISNSSSYILHYPLAMMGIVHTPTIVPKMLINLARDGELSKLKQEVQILKLLSDNLSYGELEDIYKFSSKTRELEHPKMRLHVFKELGGELKDEEEFTAPPPEAPVANDLKDASADTIRSATNDDVRALLGLPNVSDAVIEHFKKLISLPDRDIQQEAEFLRQALEKYPNASFEKIYLQRGEDLVKKVENPPPITGDEDNIGSQEEVTQEPKSEPEPEPEPKSEPETKTTEPTKTEEPEEVQTVEGRSEAGRDGQVFDDDQNPYGLSIDHLGNPTDKTSEQVNKVVSTAIGDLDKSSEALNLQQTDADKVGKPDEQINEGGLDHLALRVAYALRNALKTVKDLGESAGEAVALAFNQHFTYKEGYKDKRFPERKNLVHAIIATALASKSPEDLKKALSYLNVDNATFDKIQAHVEKLLADNIKVDPTSPKYEAHKEAFIEKYIKENVSEDNIAPITPKSKSRLKVLEEKLSKAITATSRLHQPGLSTLTLINQAGGIGPNGPTEIDPKDDALTFDTAIRSLTQSAAEFGTMNASFHNDIVDMVHGNKPIDPNDPTTTHEQRVVAQAIRDGIAVINKSSGGTREKAINNLVRNYAPYLLDNRLFGKDSPLKLSRKEKYEMLNKMARSAAIVGDVYSGHMQRAASIALANYSMHPEGLAQLIKQDSSIPDAVIPYATFYHQQLQQLRTLGSLTAEGNTTHIADPKEKEALRKQLLNDWIKTFPEFHENTNGISSRDLHRNFHLTEDEVGAIRSRTTPDGVESAIIKGAYKKERPTYASPELSHLNNVDKSRSMKLWSDLNNVKLIKKDKDKAKKLISAIRDFRKLQNKDTINYLAKKSGLSKEGAKSVIQHFQKQREKYKDLDTNIDRRYRHEVPELNQVLNGIAHNFAMNQGAFADHDLDMGLGTEYIGETLYGHLFQHINSGLTSADKGNSGADIGTHNIIRKYFEEGNNHNFFSMLNSPYAVSVDADTGHVARADATSPLKLLQNPIGLSMIVKNTIGVDAVGRRSYRFTNSLQHFVDKYLRNFNNNLNRVVKSYEGVYESNDLDYVKSFIDPEKGVNENVSLILAATAYDWTLNNGLSAAKDDYENINKLFGIEEGTYSEAVTKLLDGNTLNRDEFIRFIGGVAFKSFNFKVKDSAPENAQSLLEKSLGHMILLTMLNSGLADQKDITAGELKEANGGILPENFKNLADDAVIPLMKIDKNSPIFKGIFGSNDAEITRNRMKMDKQVIGRLLNRGPKQPLITSDPQKTNKRKLNSAFDIATTTHKVLNKVNTTPYHLKESAVILGYTNAALTRAIFGINEDKRGVFQRLLENDIGRDNNLRRQIETLADATKALHERDGHHYGPYYVTNVVWRNDRDGLIGQMGGQHNKALRYLQHAGDWKVEIPLEGENSAHAVDWFNRAVAENLFDLDASKTTDEAMLNEFEQRLQTPTIQTGINALKQILRSHDKAMKGFEEQAESVDPFETVAVADHLKTSLWEKVADAITEAGNTTFSYDALMQYTRYLMAKERGDKTFTHTMSRSADGIANGAFINHVQASTGGDIDRKEGYQYGLNFSEHDSVQGYNMTNPDAHLKLGTLWEQNLQNALENSPTLDKEIHQKFESIIGKLTDISGRQNVKFANLKTIYSAGVKTVLNDQALTNIHDLYEKLSGILTAPSSVVFERRGLTPEKAVEIRKQKEAEEVSRLDEVKHLINTFYDIIRDAGVDVPKVESIHINKKLLPSNHLEGLFKYSIKFEGDDNQISLYELDLLKHLGTFTDQLHKYYQAPLQQALNATYPHVLANRRKFNAANTVMQGVYHSLYEANYQGLLNKKNNALVRQGKAPVEMLSVGEKRMLDEQMRQFLPTVTSPTTLLLAKHLKKLLLENKGLVEGTPEHAEAIAKIEKSLTKLINFDIKNTKVELNKTELDPNVSNKAGTKVITKFKEPLKLPNGKVIEGMTSSSDHYKLTNSAGAMPISTHALEASAILQTMLDHTIGNQHDNGSTGYKQYGSMVQSLNESILESLHIYDTSLEFSDSLNQSMIALFKNKRAMEIFRNKLHEDFQNIQRRGELQKQLVADNISGYDEYSNSPVDEYGNPLGENAILDSSERISSMNIPELAPAHLLNAMAQLGGIPEYRTSTYLEKFDKDKISPEIFQSNVEGILKNFASFGAQKSLHKTDLIMNKLESIEQYCSDSRSRTTITPELKEKIQNAKKELLSIRAEGTKAQKLSQDVIQDAKEKAVLARHGRFKGSTDESEAIFGKPLDFMARVDKGNIVDIFNGLRVQSAQTDSQEHIEHLSKVVSDLYSKVVDPFELYYGTDVGANSIGGIQGDIVAIMERKWGDLPNPPLVGSNAMSPAEVFVHETSHWVADAMIGSDPFINSQVTELWNLARSKIRPIELMPPGMTKDNPRWDAEYKLAKANWNHIFTPKKMKDSQGKFYSNHLEEFMAFSVSNENFRKVISNIKIKEELKGTTLYDKVMSLFQLMLRKIENFLRGVSGDTVGERMDKLFLGIIKAKERGDLSLKNTFLAIPIVSKLGSEIRKNVVYQKTKEVLVGTTKAIEQNANKLYEKVLKSNNKYAQEFGKVLTEMKGRTEYNSNILDINRKVATEIHDNLHDTIQATASELLTRFNDDLSDAQDTALRNIALKLDLHNVVDHFSHEHVAKALVDKDEINNMIEEVKKELAPEKYNFNYLTTQALNLGIFMATGGNHLSNGFLKASLIVKKMRTAPKAKSAIESIPEEKLVSLVKVLSALYGLRHVDSTQRTELGNLFNTHSSGVKFALDMIKDYRERTHDSVFSSELRPDGYIKDIHQTLASHAMIHAYNHEDVQYYLDRGYAPVGEYTKNGQKSVTVLANKVGDTAPYMVGALRYTPNREKHSMISIGSSREERNQTVANMNAVAEREYSARKLHLDTILPAPLVDPVSGEIMGYKYHLPDAIKDKVYEPDPSFIKTFSAMAGSATLDKIKEDANHAIIEDLAAMYHKEYRANPDKFIYVGSDAKEKEHVEIWDKMPERLKDKIKTIFQTPNGMFIRKELKDFVFGYHQADIRSKIFTDPEARGPYVAMLVKLLSPFMGGDEKTIHRLIKAQDIYKEVIRWIKDAVIIKTITTTIGNTIGNIIQLTMSGVPLLTAVKQYYGAYHSFRAYREAKRHLANIDIKLQERGLSETRIANLHKAREHHQLEVEGNPLHEMISNGVSPNFIEDVPITDTYHYLGKLKKKYIINADQFKNNQLNKTSEIVKDVLKTRDSESYKHLSALAQFSDLGAKFVRYQHLIKEEGLTPQAAARRVIDEFVDYTIPQSKLMHGLDAYGGLWFAKYKMRIQKILYGMWKNRPLQMLGNLGVLSAIGMTGSDLGSEAPTHYNMITNSLLNNINDPLHMAKHGISAGYYIDEINSLRRLI